MFSYKPPYMAEQKQGDQLEPTYSSSVRIEDVALRTCQKRWPRGRSGESWSGISMLDAWQDDDDDEVWGINKSLWVLDVLLLLHHLYIYIYQYIYTYIYIYIYSIYEGHQLLQTNRMQYKFNFQQVLIQCFPSPSLVAKPRLKNPSIKP